MSATEVTKELRSQGHEVVQVSTNATSLYAYAWKTAIGAPLSLPRKGIDVYHALATLEAIWLPKSRSIATFLDLFTTTNPARAGAGMGYSRWKLAAGRSYFKVGSLIAAKCRYLVCISEKTKQDVLEYVCQDESRISVIRLGIGDDLKPLDGKPNDRFRIGALGQLDKRKRIDLLIRQFRASKIDAELVIAGAGPDREMLERIAGGDERIRFLGLIPDGALTAFYNSLDLFVFPTFIEGYGLPCLPPTESIITRSGLVDIGDIKVGDAVLTHKGRFRAVEAVHVKQYSGEIRQIKPWSLGFVVELTPEHPVLGFKRPKKRFKQNRLWAEQQPLWLNARDIEVGDCVCLPIPSGWKSPDFFDMRFVDNKLLCDSSFVYYKMGYSSITKQRVRVKRSIPLGRKLARLLGYYIAEGSVNKANASACEWSLGLEEDIYQEISKYCLELFGVQPQVTRLKTKIKVRTSTKVLAKFFSQWCGVGALNKRIPWQFLYGDIKLLSEVVDAIWRGDGHKSSDGYIWSTSSKQLANDLVCALLRLGHKPRIQYQNRRANTEYKIGYSPTNHGNYNHSNKSWIANGYIYLLVKSVSTRTYSGLIHNLTVRDDNSYTTQSFSVHNCVEAMACGKPVVVLSDAIIPDEIRTRCFATDNLTELFDNENKLDTVLRTTDYEGNLEFAKEHRWDKCVAQYVELYKKIMEDS